MAQKAKDQAGVEIAVMEVQKGRLAVCIVGTQPLICNRMSQKAKRELLLPSGRKNAMQKATSLKHEPLAEYQASPYRISDPTAGTLLAVPGAAFKKAIAAAALDMPGAQKAQIGRLTWVDGELIGVYGVPQIFSSVVRSADMNHTPDVRTRAIVPRWACYLSVTYVRPLMGDKTTAGLLAMAGLTIGIGDWRPQKGAGNYGQFRLASSDDPEFLEIVGAGGRDAQIRAMEKPDAYDDETAELLSWYDVEAAKRSKDHADEPKKKKETPA